MMQAMLRARLATGRATRPARAYDDAELSRAVRTLARLARKGAGGREATKSRMVLVAHRLSRGYRLLGEQLAEAAEAPAGGLYWTSSAAHPSLPRSEVTGLARSGRTLEQVLFGPTDSPYGTTNLFGALRRAMAKTGYSDLKEFQRVGLNLRT